MWSYSFLKFRKSRDFDGLNIDQYCEPCFPVSSTRSLSFSLVTINIIAVYFQVFRFQDYEKNKKVKGLSQALESSIVNKLQFIEAAQLLTAMEMLNDHRQNRLVHLIEQGAHKPALKLLKADNHISEEELNKSLISACQHGSKLIVRKLLRLGANINYRDTDGNTPFMISVQNGFTDIVKFLLRKHADVNACNSVGDTALILSIRSSGSTEITEILLKQSGLNIDHQNQDGYTAIMKAAEVKGVDTLKILLDEYFNVDCLATSAPHELSSTLRETVNCRGENVHQIAERCGIGSVIQLLQEHERTKISPLELAMRVNDIKSFRIFLDCDFPYASDGKKSLDSVFLIICEECSKRDIVHFSENETAMIEALLEHGVDVNTTWLDRELTGSYTFDERVELMQIAAEAGCLKVLQLLLSHNADVNRYYFSDSPLHIALSHGHTECAELLIQHGANIDFNEVLQLAVDQQDPKYVRFLIENYKNEVMQILKITYKFQEISISSVRNGNLEIIGHILDLGAEINYEVGSDMWPLAESKNGEIAKFLIDRGAVVKHRKHEKQIICDTPLIDIFMRRVITDDCVMEVMKVLLENGASADDSNFDGETPLMLAAVKEGSVSVMQFLLDHGAGLSERDRKGNTALIHAALTDCDKNVSFLIQCSKDRKELLNAQNEEGLTALMCAVRFGNLTIIKELIDQGADINIKDTLGNTCLLLLLIYRRNNDDILKYLIQAGCDVNCQNNEGLSPLMMAAQELSQTAMCILLDAGGEINAVSKTDNTKTALTFLYKSLYNDRPLIEYLLDRGASCSYLSPASLHKMIITDETHILPKLITCGLGPVCVLLNDMLLIGLSIFMHIDILHSLAYEAGKIFNFSPLCTALCFGKSVLARFFVGNLFLTNHDVFLLSHNKLLKHHLQRMNYKECGDVLTEITAQPMTLFNLSFVAVSTAVGATSGREIRVNKLPLPQMIKDKLLFKKLDVALTVPEEDITNE